MMGGVWRQPLTYFVLAGVVAFCVDAWLRREANVILITSGIRTELADEFKRNYSRAPTADELENAIQEWTDTELLFREATELGLAENDGVIRDHLARKLSQMVIQGNVPDEPTDGELLQELRAHPERYRKPDTYTISHVFINRAKAPDTFDARVGEALSKLESNAPVASVGDHFPRGPVFEGLSQAHLEANLNLKLSSVLKPSEVGVWHRLPGARGMHFVRVDAVVSGEPTLDNSRASLSGAVTASKKGAAAQTYVRELREKFTVIDESQP